MKKTVKICIYNKSSSKNDVLLGNGDAILDNICIECKVHENLDGTYEIDAEFIIDNEGLWQHIEEEAILKVRLDYGYEYFRITKPRKTSNRIIVYGRQVTIYETMHLWLTDVRPENQNGLGALKWILDNATGIKELEVMSDIETTSTAYYMDMNMYEALHDCDQSFFNRWGGEIQRRGYTLRINQRIGTDRGVEIRSRKNLIGFEAETNIDNVVTRIKPKGFDGITIDGYVDSEYINKYPRIKTKEIKYEKVKVKGENSDDGYETLAEAQAELTRLAKLEYTDNKIDVITAEYNISFVDLSKTEEYKEYVAAERVYLGDTVNVYEEKLDINVSVRAIDRVYDVLGERVEEIKLSNKDITKLHSMNDILTDILKGVQENDNSLQLYIQKIINSGIQDSYVFYNKAELVICDSPEIENAINVWRFNRGGLAHSSNGYSGPYNVAITYDGKINADMILAGLVKGNYIDARNLTVTRTDGTRTLEVTAGGDVNLNVNSLKIQSEDAATKSYVTQTADSITSIVEDKYATKSELTQTSDSITSAVEDKYATKSELTQTSDSITSIFSQSGAYNLIYNGDFKNGLNNWSLNGPDLTYIGVEYGTISPNNNVSARIYGTIGQEASLKQSVDVSTQEAITVSYWMYTANWGVDGATGIDGTTNPFRNLQMIITYTDDTTDVFGMSEWQININTWEKFTFTAYPTKKTKSIEIGLYNRDTSRVVFYTDIMVEYGIQATRFTPNPNEIMDGIIRLDKNGITVLQGNNKSLLDSQALKFYENDIPYSRIEGGALEFTDTLGGRVSRMGRYVFSESGAYVNMLQAYYGQATAIGAIQTNTDNEPIVNYISASIDTMLSSNYYIKQGGNIFQTWVHNQLWFRPYSEYDYAYPGGVISTYNNEDFNIHGCDNLHLGILAGMEMKTGLSIVEDPTATNGCHIRANGPFDLNGFAIYGGQIVNSVDATSPQTYALMTASEEESYSDPTSKTITNIYGVQSVDNGDVRWTDRETYFTSEVETGVYECYIEIPWWLAQNLENDYHVSITPTNGFYQYYVSERDPYYFIVRSDKDSMGFTFEIVGKLLDNNTTANNASIAGDQYLASDLKEPEAANIITKQEDIIDDGEQS